MVQNAHAEVRRSNRRGRDFSTTPSASKEVGQGREGHIQEARQGKKIDPERNDRAYIEKIRKKHWGEWKLDTFRRNWKSSTAEFRIAKFKDGARARSAAEDKQG